MLQPQRILAAASAFSLLMLATAHAASEPIRYTVRFPAPQTHYAEVEALLPTGGQPSVELFMAVWTPGSYLVREYARNLEAVTAQDAAGADLPVRKTRKNRWLVETGRAAAIRVHYRVYCREMSVRTNWVDDEFALLNGAPTFLSLADKKPREHQVVLDLPASWRRSLSGMQETAPNHFTAPDYDTLVDSPILAGNPAVYDFEVDGKKHFLVNQGEAGIFDGRRAVQDVEKIVRENKRLWGSLPYDKYVFLNLLVEAGGGLEHKNSFCAMGSRFATRTREGYVGWLGLVSHEYFHAWNVKRLRPVELGPFDYEAEVYTKGLWVSEGFTDYYGSLNVHRAGVTSHDEFLSGAAPEGTPRAGRGGLSGLVAALQNTPGRLEHPVAMSSYDAWIKFYRPDENSANTDVSYYVKGAVIAWLLDAKVRKATNDAKSLDDVMRLAYERYSGPHGFTDAEFRKTAQDIAGIDLQPWFHHAVDTTRELDYSEALDWLGLRFRPNGERPGAPKKSTLGFETKLDNGRLLVSRVPRETPAFQAGFNVDDEILAIGDFRVKPDQWAQRMDVYHPGEKISVLVARRDRLVRIEAVLVAEPARQWRLEIRPDRTPEQTRHFDSWLHAGHAI